MSKKDNAFRWKKYGSHETLTTLYLCYLLNKKESWTPFLPIVWTTDNLKFDLCIWTKVGGQEGQVGRTNDTTSPKANG